MSATQNTLPFTDEARWHSLPPICAVAVLFARRDSVYKRMPGLDVWDTDRDARNFAGGMPVVAHPPCRAWGGLAHMAKPAPGEKELAPWAVEQVRKWGGVLEHPIRSKLWPACGLPEPKERDEAGGFTIEVQQFWWGHRAEKWTRLYICGCEPEDLPAIPKREGRPERVVSTGHGLRVGHPNFRSRCTDREREATPPALAEWLVTVAKLCRHNVEVTRGADRDESKG